MGIEMRGAIFVLAAAAFVAPPALAEDAEELVSAAEELIAKGDYEHACPKLREANAAKPSLPTLQSLAECDDKAGNAANAYQEWSELVDRAKAAYADDVVKRAEARKAALAETLAKVVFIVPKTTRLSYSIALDGTVLEASRIGVELLLAAGKHHLKVTTNGGPETQMDTDFEVPGKLARSTVTIPLDKPGDAVAPRPSPGQFADGQVVVIRGVNGAPLPDEPTKRNSPAMIAGGSILIGLGVASIFTAAGFGLAAIGNDDYGAPAWGFFLGGVIGIGAGIPILVIGAIKRPVSESSAGVSAAIPEVRVGAGSVSATWSF
ncbi:MAG: hypothetical protein U0414_06175 [Polyangiaceae bacterium]